MSQRKQHHPQFKAKGALDALKREETVSEAITNPLATVLVAAAGFIALALVYTEAVAQTGRVGAFVVFAHTLDGVSTAVGVDVLGAGEQTPLPRLIMEFAATLPTAQYSVGWLFVLTKVLLAVLIVAVFADYVKEAPSRARAFLALLAAVGFGPGVFNLLVFLVSASPTG